MYFFLTKSTKTQVSANVILRGLPPLLIRFVSTPPLKPSTCLLLSEPWADPRSLRGASPSQSAIRVEHCNFFTPGGRLTITGSDGLKIGFEQARVVFDALLF